MDSSNDPDSHDDWERFGKKTRDEINAQAAQEKERLGLSRYPKRLRAHIHGRIYDVTVTDVSCNATDGSWARGYSFTEPDIPAT
ncbi:MAG: hypothetical protein QOJ39_1590 [Candidatus Eremiobacteraeota bacterium]|nr:hypothetical protein [Candidatus Eremiobacteraeota bacterium]